MARAVKAGKTKGNQKRTPDPYADVLQPDDLPEGLPWPLILRAAFAGSSEARIMRGLRLSEESMRERGVLDRFRQEVETAREAGNLALQSEILDCALRPKRSGSVNLKALAARNRLDWDRQKKSQEKVPDLSTAKERMRATMELLAKQRSEIEGRTVTIEMILHREAFGAWPEDLAVIAAGGVPPVDPLLSPEAGR